MSLLSPSLNKEQIDRVLEAAEVLPAARKNEKKSASAELEAAGLGLDRIATDLGFLAENAGSEAIKMRALELALKAHGALQPEVAQVVPSLTIVIHDSTKVDVNPILIPR